jgi:hypothetical protein
MLVVLTQVMANLKMAVETFAKQIRKKISFPTPLPCVLNFLGKLFPNIMLCMKVKQQRYFPALFTQWNNCEHFQIAVTEFQGRTLSCLPSQN